MKAAAIVYDFPSLSQTFVLAQIEGLIRLGCDVRIFADGADTTALSDGGPDREMMDRVTYFGLPFRRLREALAALQGRFSDSSPTPASPLRARAPRKSPRLRFEARGFRNENSFGVIHAHFGPNGVRAIRLRGMGVISGPVVTSFYGYDVGRIAARHGYGDLFRDGEAFIALSDHMRNSLLELGSPPDRTIVHRLGVDLQRFRPTARSVNRKLEIVSIARLVPKKGIEYALRAVAALVSRNVALNYTVVGDGPLRRALERLAVDLGLGRTIRFAGAMAHRDLPEVLRSSDVLLAPSVTAADGDAEGTPVAILEAQACALPVVATRHAGIPEIVLDGKSGFLVEERDVAALGEKLAQLAESPRLRQSMGNAGRAIVTEKHDIDRLNRDLRRIYDRLVAGSALIRD